MLDVLEVLETLDVLEATEVKRSVLLLEAAESGLSFALSKFRCGSFLVKTKTHAFRLRQQ